ncbi:hypothetical protein OG893_26465 [Streptomyces sp. NBC_01696]|uniref:hypothetical protein n=1 Tax=Streptomyces sp. NBC_01696 TaxID=2975913 RepID=UPI002E375D38|nr:hypothetical protein [Streptomyces sp. NBC_01696]
MSEPKKPGSEEKPLTPAEQQQEDKERVTGQLVVTDVTRQMQDVMEVFGFGGGSSGRTSFEGHELNAMIDLIENSKPEHLEEAGKSLLSARSALEEAAGELEGFIDGVEWEGESGTAFRDWGKGLVVHTRKLGAFAEVAGTQITVAGTGLASVRNSLPPRDSRLVRKSPEDIESPARIEENPEYAAALKVEKDRQEAINQANRLASYYAVSEETLAAQEPPRFEKKLDVAMPRPQGDGLRPVVEPGSSSSGSESPSNVDSGSIAGNVEAGRPGSSERGRGFETPVAVAPVPERGVSTEIDSVATPPAPVTTPPTTPPAPTTGPAGPGGGQNLPLANGFVNPLTNSSRGPQTPTSAPRAVGRAGGDTRTGSGPASNSRTTGPQVGRPSPMNGGTPSARGATGPQSPTAGRSGVTGGRPTSVGHAGTSGTAAPRAGRGGIVGGTPQRSAPGASGGMRGAPRGTVIGTGGAARPGGSVGGVGQRGVVGNGSGNAPRPAGRGTPSANGVVGTPRGGPARPGAGAKGFTAGGAGLVRGPAGRKDSGDEDQDDGTPRPDYLTEDRETWEAGRRGVAPPVIE